MRRVRFVCLASLCLCAICGQAQQPGEKPPSAPTTPPEKIQSLVKALAGHWATDEKYEPGFLTPNGGTGRGESVFRSGPGGFTLIEEYHAQTPAGKLFGLGIIWFDAARGLQHIWCINVYPDGCEMFPPPPQPGPQWDGKTLVLHFESGQGEKRLVFHEVFSDITSNSLTQRVTIAEGEAPPKLWLTIHSTRLGEAVVASTGKSENH